MTFAITIDRRPGPTFRAAWSSIHIVWCTASTFAENWLYCIWWLEFWGYRDFVLLQIVPELLEGTVHVHVFQKKRHLKSDLQCRNPLVVVYNPGSTLFAENHGEKAFDFSWTWYTLYMNMSRHLAKIGLWSNKMNRLWSDAARSVRRLIRTCTFCHIWASTENTFLPFCTI